MDLKSRLKSVTDKVLGEIPDTWDDPGTAVEIELEQAKNKVRIQPDERRELINALNSLVMKGYGKSREINRNLAWRCLNCKTINGLHRGSYKEKDIRKTCGKCARPRSNPLTVAQEVAIDVIIETEGITYEDAKARVTVNG